MGGWGTATPESLAEVDAMTPGAPRVAPVAPEPGALIETTVPPERLREAFPPQGPAIALMLGLKRHPWLHCWIEPTTGRRISDETLAYMVG